MGSGIGLSLVKELVELHKGRITVESTANKGSIFSVFLPAGDGHLKPEEKISAYKSRTGGPVEVGSYSEFEDLRQMEETPLLLAQEDAPIMLIVEDNRDVRNYIISNFDGTYLIEIAQNGQEGFEKATDLIPEIIISDVMMPEMNGYQLCEKLKTDPKTSHIPIILLTAKAAEEDKLQGLETGADVYLAKPFNPKELQIRVRKLIEQRQKLREKFRQNIQIGPQDVSVTSTDQIFLEQAMKLTEQNIHNSDFNVEGFASQMAMSRMQLHRKLKALTGQSTTEFIRSMRLKRAAQLLKQKSGTISDIAYDVGFNNLSYFIRSFTKQFGISPSQYK